MKKLIATILCICIIAGASVPAMAVELSVTQPDAPVVTVEDPEELTTSGVTTLGENGQGSSILAVSAPVSQMTVTVPTVLPAYIDKKGDSYSATNATIRNYSYGPIKVESIKVYPAEGWELVESDYEFIKAPLDTKKLYVAVQGQDADVTTGDIAVYREEWPVISGHGGDKVTTPYHEAGFTYEVKTPGVRDGVTLDPAIVTFTVDWNTAENTGDGTETSIGLNMEHGSMSISQNTPYTFYLSGNATNSSLALSISDGENGTLGEFTNILLDDMEKDATSTLTNDTFTLAIERTGTQMFLCSITMDKNLTDKPRLLTVSGMVTAADTGEVISTSSASVSVLDNIPELTLTAKNESISADTPYVFYLDGVITTQAASVTLDYNDSTTTLAINALSDTETITAENENFSLTAEPCGAYRTKFTLTQLNALTDVGLINATISILGEAGGEAVLTRAVDLICGTTPSTPDPTPEVDPADPGTETPPASGDTPETPSGDEETPSMSVDTPEPVPGEETPSTPTDEKTPSKDTAGTGSDIEDAPTEPSPAEEPGVDAEEEPTPSEDTEPTAGEATPSTGHEPADMPPYVEQSETPEGEEVAPDSPETPAVSGDVGNSVSDTDVTSP